MIPELMPTGATEEHLDSFAATAVYAESAFLHAQRNQLLLPSEEPKRINSLGFDLQKTCARIVSNDIETYRTPLRARESDVAFNFNFIAHGANGVFLTCMGRPARCTWTGRTRGRLPASNGSMTSER